MILVTQILKYVLLFAITAWMGINMKENVKESSESKWDILNQMFVIDRLANQAYSEIYKHKADPWKVYRTKCKMLYQIESPLNAYLLFQELYDKLELPEKQIMSRHFCQ